MDLNFLSNFNNYLLNNDFLRLENEFSNKDVYFKNIGSNGYLIVPTLKGSFSYENYFDYIEENAKYVLKKLNLNKIFLVKILISDVFLENDISFLDYSLNLDNKIINIVWGVDLKNENLIVKSNQPAKFLDLEKYIKNSFSNNIIKENKNYITSKNTYATYSLIFIITFVHIIISISPIFDKNYIIYKYGISPNLFESKEYYRLITFLFLHSGLTHLTSNLLSLYIFGTRIEKYLGKAAFLLIFILGGLSSGIFSILFTKTYSVGASGAIFALESATLYFSIKEKIKLDGLDYYTIAIFSIIGILASFSKANIDNAGHIGGFLMGIIVCFIYYNIYYKNKLQ